MNTPNQPASKGAVLMLMTFVLLWSGALAVGFGYAAVAGADETSTTRTAVYALLAGFTGLLAGRTGFEMVRKVRQT
jgi:hypothetical protein